MARIRICGRVPTTAVPTTFRTTLAIRPYVAREAAEGRFVMKHTPFRVPFRSRTVVPSGAGAHVSEAGLRQGAAWTQLVLLALCAARAGIDLHNGRVTIEGDVALALLIVFTVWLAVELLGGAARRAIWEDDHAPYRASKPMAIGADITRRR
jgi:hypothetical protein